MVAFFHRIATGGQANNHIKGIYNRRGQWVSNCDDIDRVLLGHFINLFSKENIDVDHWERPVFNAQTVCPFSHPTSPFLEDEIDKAIHSMVPWKASSPDGFPLGFYQHFWDVLKQDIYRFIQGVYNDHIVDHLILR